MYIIENSSLDVRGALANGIYSEGVNIFTLKNPLQICHKDLMNSLYKTLNLNFIGLETFFDTGNKLGGINIPSLYLEN